MWGFALSTNKRSIEFQHEVELFALHDGTLSREALSFAVLRHERERKRRKPMGRYALLWLLGVPIPILLLIWAFGGLH
jgi:hypothetical protein